MLVLIVFQWLLTIILDYKPAEVLWLNGKGHLIRERETFEDILRNQIEVTF